MRKRTNFIIFISQKLNGEHLTDVIKRQFKIQIKIGRFNNQIRV